MKRTALLAAAAALFAATPAAANGYLGAEYLTGESDVIIGNADSDGWQGEGAFGFGGDGFGGQIDGSYGNIDLDGTGIDFDAWSLGGHLWWNFGSWRLGGVVVAADAETGSPFEFDEMAYGVEGTWDLGPSVVLIGSLTRGDGEFAGVLDYETFNLDVGARFYATPNVRLGGFLGTGNADIDGLGDADSLSFGLNGEFQPWSAPVSFTVGWNTFEIEDIDVEADMFHIGARWNFGGGTLRDRDNSVPFETRTGVLQRTLGTW